MILGKLVKIASIAVVAALFVASPTSAFASQMEYVAGTWNDNAVHYLDGGLSDLGSFPAGAQMPNGIATDGNMIWTGHFASQEVIAYDMTGVEQFRWSGPLGNLQGMEYISTRELAIYNFASGSNVVEFYDPFSGAFVRSIPGQSSIEGLAYDGRD
ncbi:MAG: hypothetical protein KKB50_12825, partial [Planctomycetes bacterium]|nr:hypothetical protein [Planctomycetota bacterium]